MRYLTNAAGMNKYEDYIYVVPWLSAKFIYKK